MAAVRHLELLFEILGPRSMFGDRKPAFRFDRVYGFDFRGYLQSNVSQIWLEISIRAPKFYALKTFICTVYNVEYTCIM